MGMPPRGMSLEAQLNTGFPLPLAGLLPKLVPSFLELKPQFRPAKANTYEALQAVSLWPARRIIFPSLPERSEAGDPHKPTAWKFSTRGFRQLPQGGMVL